VSFTEDWITERVQHWPVADLAGWPKLTAVEIGCFEGRASVWMLEHVLTHPSARLICIDPFGGLTWHHLDPGDYRSRFYENIRPYLPKVIVLEGFSQLVMRESLSRLAGYGMVDLFYVDGNHTAPEMLEDILLAWRYLKNGGLMILDDYEWHVPNNPLLEPKIAIDSFLAVFSGRYELLRKEFQVIVRKTHDGAL